MIQFKNIVPVDLDKGTPAIINLSTVTQGDANANRIGGELYNGKTPVDLTGATCAGICRRNDGNEVPLTGTISGNVAYVTLDANCYEVQGTITVFVTIVSGNDEITFASAYGDVVTRGGTALIQPVERLPDYAQLLAAIGAMEDATAAAEAAAAKSVRFDTAQSLTEAQKTQARQNIGVDEVTGNYVSYAEDQSLTSEQKLQARENIDAGAGLVSFAEAQSLTEAQKTQARQNIGAEGGSGDTSALEAQIEALAQFVNYTDIATFTMSPSAAEIGSASASVALAWTFNSTPSSLTLNGVSKSVSSTGETVTAADDGSTHQVKYTLATAIGAKELTFHFWLKVYYGAAEIPESVNSAFLLGLANGVLTGSRARTFSVNAGASQYIWYAVPARYGACTFKVGGFDGGFEAAQTVSVTNASGYTENYYVYRSTNAALGNTSVTVS